MIEMEKKSRDTVGLETWSTSLRKRSRVRKRREGRETKGDATREEREPEGVARKVLYAWPLPPSFHAPFGSVPGSNERAEDWFPYFEDVVL